MQKEKIYGWTLIFFILTWLPASQAWTDGGYFSSSSSRSVAVSADQRAIIIKNGNEISMTFSTGYTGEGEDFGWIIPTPVPPATEDVSEAGENVEIAFEILDEDTAPVIYTSTDGRGCFPSGTEVLTASGPRAIGTVDPGTKVYSCDLATGEWILKRVLKRQLHQYEGDMMAIQMGHITIQATGNHPLYVLRGDRLASRPLPQDIPKEEQRTTEHGRWVEARDLKEGDVLNRKSGEGLIITSLSSRHKKIEVYNLNVEDYHNYAVHQKGILVHNKGGKALAEEETAPDSAVRVYGTVTLEHYEVSILGAAAASALLNWLRKNDYQVNPAAMTDDIRFKLDPNPNEFRVYIRADADKRVAIGIKTERGWFSDTATTAGGFSITFLLTTMVYPRSFISLIPAVGLDVVWSKNIMENTASYLLGVELNMSFFLLRLA